MTAREDYSGLYSDQDPAENDFAVSVATTKSTTTRLLSDLKLDCFHI